ncbi:hypothetical protein AS27_07152 [Aptenodytes forsteri]|uniref:Coiled-coil domain-containing protein 70 n=1 Tax=Aptenodytes forsteri TaxID=9233 RepID=A0A087QIG7_APTFO|nr:hypothetical protein AS27_07152 [Aptenodytes forsteri]
MSLSRWYFRVSQFTRSSLLFGYKLMVYFKNIARQLITDVQEKVITLEENQSLWKWQEIRRENISSLWEKKKDMITAFQDKNKVAWEKNMTLWKKTMTLWSNVKTLLMDEVEVWGEDLDQWKIGLDLWKKELDLWKEEQEFLGE